MEEIKVYDQDGKQITMLVQWDLDVYIYIRDDRITTNHNVHFFNSESDVAYVVSSTYEDGILCCKIPNRLLFVALPITGYIYTTEDDDTYRSTYVFSILVRSRVIPSDFMYIPDAMDDYISAVKVLAWCEDYAKSACQCAADAEDWATISKSWAVGDTGARDGEDTDNSKYYCQEAATSASNAATSEKNAKTSETNAKTSENNAKSSADAAAESAEKAAVFDGSLYALKQYYDNNSMNVGRVSESDSGFRSFAIGDNVIASGAYSHAEGFNTEASGDGSHAEGHGYNRYGNTTASGIASHAEGGSTEASGDYAHTEGYIVTASGNYSHAEGSDTVAYGNYSHAEGYQVKAYGNYSHAEGYQVKAYGNYSHAEGYSTITGDEDDNSRGTYAHAEGHNTISTSYSSHAEGDGTEAISFSAHAEGDDSKAYGIYSHAEGYNTTAESYTSHAEGWNTSATKSYAHAEGFNTIAGEECSHASGCGTQTNTVSETVVGQYNAIYSYSGTSIENQVGDAFTVGNGVLNGYRSNAFRVTKIGSAFVASSYNTSGADYAEFIREWADGNTDEEDRVGYFVTIKDGYLYKASGDDYIIGITSGNPGVVGNSDEDYYWKYERDDFGRIIFENVEEETIEPIIESPNDDDNDETTSCLEKETENESADDNTTIVDDEDGNMFKVTKTGNIIKNAVMKLSDDYDSSLQSTYIERKDRPEWDYVGIIGVIPVRDDGTCKVDGFCKCGSDGIATYAEERGFDTYYVIERISDNVVSVILR